MRAFINVSLGVAALCSAPAAMAQEADDAPRGPIAEPRLELQDSGPVAPTDAHPRFGLGAAVGPGCMGPHLSVRFTERTTGSVTLLPLVVDHDRFIHLGLRFTQDLAGSSKGHVYAVEGAGVWTVTDGAGPMGTVGAGLGARFHGPQDTLVSWIELRLTALLGDEGIGAINPMPAMGVTAYF